MHEVELEKHKMHIHVAYIMTLTCVCEFQLPNINFFECDWVWNLGNSEQL